MNNGRPLPSSVVDIRSVKHPGLCRRAIATLFDGFLLFAGWVIVVPALDMPFGLTGSLTDRAQDHLDIHPGNFGQLFPIFVGIWAITALIAAILSYWLYATIFQSSSRQATPGEIALSIKVTDLEGLRISFKKGAVRNLVKTALGPVLVVFLIAAFTSKKQALHDIIAGCLVVADE